MYKIDLQTHSILSHDGGITKQQYKSLLDKKIVDFIAITDHNEINFALEINKSIGNKVIVGEEVKTTQGEVIGLYLRKLIQPKMSLSNTIDEIKAQGGLVYIPHPFEKIRSGIQKVDLAEIIAKIDIFEVFNSRSLNKNMFKKRVDFADKHSLPQASSSDAHCHKEVGSSYSEINSVPDKDNLASVLKNASLKRKNVSLRHRLCPKINKLKKLYA